ncbi:putative protocadherin-11 X-linked isoform X1 [Sesbania bispinosa]|nr:putative protocadherin-11 X-linked isoform X1 [Sesbania bispinosa]
MCHPPHRFPVAPCASFTSPSSILLLRQPSHDYVVLIRSPCHSPPPSHARVIKPVLCASSLPDQPPPMAFLPLYQVATMRRYPNIKLKFLHSRYRKWLGAATRW